MFFIFSLLFLFVSQEPRSHNLSQVYRYGDGTLVDNSDLVQYYSKIQDCVRRKCNENKNPNPFSFEKAGNSDVIVLNPDYYDKLECIRKCIEDTDSKIIDLQHELLEWIDEMKNS